VHARSGKRSLIHAPDVSAGPNSGLLDQVRSAICTWSLAGHATRTRPRALATATPRPSDAMVAPSGTVPVEVLAATVQLSGVPGEAVSVDDIALGGRDDDGVHAAEAQMCHEAQRRHVARARTAWVT
jgi:hypothetical protein